MHLGAIIESVNCIKNNTSKKELVNVGMSYYYYQRSLKYNSGSLLRIYTSLQK